MSKIFRLHTGGSDTIKDWSRINSHLTESLIDTIEDPAGANSKNQITSIPSPLARLDLVRVAFKQVAANKQFLGNTIYHKIVSDSLDVAQIFFNLDSFRDRIEVIAWNPGITRVGSDIKIDENSDLGKLVYSKNENHSLFGRTLELFLSQDSRTYNFADLNRIYLLNYKNGPDPLNIIGGTSPTTLFFSSPNSDLSNYVDIPFGTDRVFDDKYCPLINRASDFILYIYSLQQSIPSFSIRFRELSKYLDDSFSLLKDELKDQIRMFSQKQYLEGFLGELALTYVDHPGNSVEIFNYSLRNKTREKVESDFEILPTKSSALKPLVLPNEQFNTKLNYAGGEWQHDYRAPYFDNRPISERSLPEHTYIKHPYLTVSDFLEPYLIKVPYPVNRDKYFTGGYLSDVNGFILPLKKEFFKYFSIKDLDKPLGDGKKMFELSPLLNGAMKVVLRIPIRAKDRYIEFSRSYTLNQFSDKVTKPDELHNKGIIVDNQFGLSIYPFIKTGDDSNAHYRVMLIDRDVSPLTKYNEYSLNFYKDNALVDNVKYLDKKQRSKKGNEKDNFSTFYYVLEKEFDFIEITSNSASGIIIPAFKPISGGSKKFTFAIDFGTTNTHIEYKIDSEKERPFEIKENDIQIGSMNYNDQSTEALLRNPSFILGADMLVKNVPLEFLPEKIEKNSDYSFPQRTVIADHDNFNIDSDSTYSLADFNIPFGYLKQKLSDLIEITPNLKWSNFKNDKKLRARTEKFIDLLLLLIRNKILLNGGSLKDTQIIWFYPSSMSGYRRGIFQATWENLSKKYIGSNKPIQKMSESIAPFYYYKERAGTPAYDKPVACIDIGGGTTDVVIFRDNKPVRLTSFKYAANAIFGDGYGNSPSTNGFVLKYEPRLLNSLKNSTAKDLANVLEDLKNKHTKSIELIEFFFSLENNKKIQENNIPISFADELKHDSDFKVVFLFFYGSIMYHVATLMKLEDMEPPRYINFSGTASKLLNIADPNPRTKNLEDFTKIIFQEVYGGKTIDLLEIKQFDDPKEITCKGGILCSNYADVEDVEHHIKAVLLGDKNNTLLHGKELTYSDVENTNMFDSVLSEVSGFIDKFFTWANEHNFKDKFDLNPNRFLEYKNWLKEDMRQYLIAGLKEKLNEVQETAGSEIEETLFFYSLIGSLNKLAFNIQKSSL